MATELTRRRPQDDTLGRRLTSDVLDCPTYCPSSIDPALRGPTSMDRQELAADTGTSRRRGSYSCAGAPRSSPSTHFRLSDHPIATTEVAPEPTDIQSASGHVCGCGQSPKENGMQTTVFSVKFGWWMAIVALGGWGEADGGLNSRARGGCQKFCVWGIT